MATLITEAGILLGVIVAMINFMKKVSDGQKCILRAEMLRIYYKHQIDRCIRQYEYENFVYLYEAYKALKGNSFIDKIYDEIKEWRIIS